MEFEWQERDGVYYLVYKGRNKYISVSYYDYIISNTIVVKHEQYKYLKKDWSLGLVVDYKMMNINSPITGLFVDLIQQHGLFEIKQGQPILKIDPTENAQIEKLKYIERKKIEEKDIEEKRLKREKEEIARKIKERYRKRELEKIVRQELIDSGELFGDKPKRPPIPREVVDAVYRRDGGRCVYCGSTENLQIDHIIPFSKGGATTLENLQLLCGKCNIEKSNKIG